MTPSTQKRILFVANNETSEFTGGTRIWIEFVRRWKDAIVIEGSSEAAMHLWKEVGNCYFYCTCKEITDKKPTVWNLLKNSLYRTYRGLHAIKTADCDYLYSVSDFLPDVIPCWWYKITHKSVKWLAGFYLVVPPPFSKRSPYKGVDKVKATLYWLQQQATRAIVNHFADCILVTSEPEKEYFKHKKVVVVRGGVDLTESEKYIQNKSNQPKKYDAVFVGRFHPQKGVLELIDIWKIVCSVIPDAKLAMIGDGDLYEKVFSKICTEDLGINIDLLGYANGKEKFEIFKQSKVFVHPATFDSGGMACAEAMAWGLPAVGFNLPAYRTYYPQGMAIAVNKRDFAYQIIELLTVPEWYALMSFYSLQLIRDKWDWEKRAEEIYEELFNDKV